MPRRRLLEPYRQHTHRPGNLRDSRREFRSSRYPEGCQPAPPNLRVVERVSVDIERDPAGDDVQRIAPLDHDARTVATRDPFQGETAVRRFDDDVRRAPHPRGRYAPSQHRNALIPEGGLSF